ncbi:ABCC1 [Lepeophtheirus salmonis]|uniref:ABCC1 n=1 Tax=Lepeophtheirus salmonis TaxID=72036 RepID=A0A7R8CHD3_LEPSM|nr:ABCC1 [Lepeophtheirus salmonis]CAF2823358.1 ABCC1 [Lepeophtheirus salmonis]
MRRKKKTPQKSEGNEIHFYKIGIFGGGGVGKSCLTFRFQNKQFLELYNPTILDSFINKSFMVDGVIRPLEIMDTAGQDEFKNMRDLYLKTSDGLFFVYDVTNRDSFREISELINCLKLSREVETFDEIPPTIIIGNKCDLNAKRKISFEEGQSLADKFGPNVCFEETSAKEDINIIKVFEDILSRAWDYGRSLSKTRVLVLLTSGLYDVIAYALIIMGLFVLVLSIMGCCGISKRSPRLMLIYSICLVIMILAEAAIGALAYCYRDYINSELRVNLFDKYQREYGNEDSITKAIDQLQVGMKCCGVDSFEDWKKTEWWNQTDIRQKNLVPDSCCLTPSAFCGVRDHPSIFDIQQVREKKTVSIVVRVRRSNYLKSTLDLIREVGKVDVRELNLESTVMGTKVFAAGFSFRNWRNIHRVPNTDLVTLSTIVIQYPVVVILLFMGFWADGNNNYNKIGDNDLNPSSLRMASFTPGKKSVTDDDLYEINDEFKSCGVLPSWDREMEKEIRRKHLKNKPINILWPLVRSFKSTLLASSALQFFYSVFQFGAPQLVDLIINFVSDPKEPIWKGYLYLFAICSITFINTLIYSQSNYYSYITGLKIRTSLTSSIFNKAVNLKSSSKKQMSVGETTNLMAIDSQRLMDFCLYIDMIWSSPLKIIIAMYLLWQVLGPASLAGLAVMILLIPINIVVGKKVKKFTAIQMQNKDKRIKLMDDILNGIKVLKLYAWEPSFIDAVTNFRVQEIGALKKSALINAVTSFMWTSAPFLVALASFTTYVLIDEKNILTPSTAFVSLTLFNLLRLPLNLLPMMIMKAIQSKVSLDRINLFLNKEDLDLLAISHESQGLHAVKMCNVSLSWETDEGLNTLEDIDLDIEKGSLVAIVGQVGSGKSSLLSGILGEMEIVRGSINVDGQTIYAPQQPWLQNETLRNNILFGKRFNKKLYRRVIDACALSPDLDMLPAGDLTEIGERGINLSGGQKARVSLARCTYNNGDIYILDDPLSAVDVHVGRHLFENVISSQTGLLKNKTRIFVTHGAIFLPQTDKIIVMKNGVISESGTYRDLIEKENGEFAQFLINYLVDEKENILKNDQDLKTIIKDLESTVGGSEELEKKTLRSGAKQVKRIESISRSPIYSHFAETLTGIPTIRAFGMVHHFIDENVNKIDFNAKCYFPTVISSRWLAVRLETLGNILVIFVALFSITSRGTTDPGMVGLSLSYALSVTTILNMLITVSTDIPRLIGLSMGVIKFDNYKTRYRKGLDLVLKGINCTIQKGEKIGIVGRTGAGKSSLTLALFRIIEPSEDPILFSGSLRMNLDPFEAFADRDIWIALEYSHLKSFVWNLGDGLNFSVLEGGRNLSVGQRQLICLARAILRKTQILVLDEATAAIDLETDDLIQSTIRSEFKDSTVLTIAHRINTIMDSNRIMVLDAGTIAEFDDPQNFVSESRFYVLFFGK